VGNWVIWFGVVVLLAMTWFSTLNTALRIPSRARVAARFEKSGRAPALERLVALRPQYLMATAILRSAAVLLLFVDVLHSMEVFESTVPLTRTAIGCVAAWLLVLVFGVAIPNAWAKYSGDSLLLRSMPFLSAVRLLCYPVIAVLEVFDPVVRRLAGVPVQDARSYADELEQEILRVVSEGERHGAVDEEEKEMIESVIELGDTRVEEIMTPRTEIVAIPKEMNLDDVLETIREKGHSRIPVYDGTIDTILGILYAKDLLRRTQDSPFALNSVMRQVLFIPESKLVRDLLREFQTEKVHMAVVLDEYGGTAGLVTIEDILEELVGEITDEYDTEEAAELKRIDEFTVEVDARMRIDELNDQLDIELPEDEDYETIGGFVFSTLGKIPSVGETCEHKNIGVQVIGAEPRRITQLRLKITPTDKDESSPEG
jgi:CBS domain containing-hemolysin-like protein